MPTLRPMSKSPIQGKPFQKQFADILEFLCRKFDLETTFQDVIEAYNIAQWNVFYREAESEERFKQIRSKYDDEEWDTVAKLNGIAIKGMTVEGGDWIGEVFHQIGLGDPKKGQFFTPFNVSSLVATAILEPADELLRTVRRRGFITVSEPASGSGGMILALVDRLKEIGIDPQRQMFVYANDLSRLASHMCYYQLGLHGIAASVAQADTITLQVYWNRVTPSVFLDRWDARFLSRAIVDDVRNMVARATREPVGERDDFDFDVVVTNPPFGVKFDRTTIPDLPENIEKKKREVALLPPNIVIDEEKQLSFNFGDDE